ncbi:MAG: class I SAM-dependent methyltransferase [Bacteroidota bacterium]
MTTISEHTTKYWQYQYDVAKDYMLPLLQGWGVQLQGADLLDVGCGTGGGTCATCDAGALCVGFDINERLIDEALVLQNNRTIHFESGNMYEQVVPFGGRKFDLVVLHDVFEHLDDKDATMQKLASYLKPTGKILITFPPYFSAYGAHQQLLRAPFARLPFFHLLPFAISTVLPRLKGEHPYFVEEVTKLGRLKMGMKEFERIAARNHLTIDGKQAYLIGPNHIRFGLKPIAAGPVAEIPLLGELLSSGVVYLLSPTRNTR